MSKIIEAKAIISGEDRLSGVLDKLNSKLKQVGKGTKISGEIDRLNKSLGSTKAQLAAIGKINAAQEKLSGAKLGLHGAQAKADRITAALASAKKAGDVAVAADLAGQQRAANRAVSQASGAVERQTAALRDGRRELNAFGAPVTNLVAHERALQQSVERTTTALNGQAKAQRDRERAIEARSLKIQKRQEAVERAATQSNAGAGNRRPRGPAEPRHGSERNLAPLAGAFGAYEAASAYKQAAAFDRRMTMIGQTADAGRTEIDGLSASVHDLAQQTAVPVDKLAGGLEALVAQGRNLKESMGFLPSVARTAAASGSEVEDIAKTADSVGTNFEITGRQMQKAFDIMAAGGKAGQFELKDMARYLPSLGPAASAIGFKGEKGLADLVAMLQVMRKGSGTAEEAVASMNNILAKMESDKTKKNFKALGVDAEGAFKKARTEGRNLVEVFEELVDTALKGDRSRLGELIDDMEFKRGVQALMAYRREWQKLSATLQSTSGGTVARDLVQVTKDAQASVDRLSNSWQRFTQMGSRLADAGGVSVGLSGVAKEFEGVAVALERINKAYAEGGLPKVLSQAASDAGERLKANRKEWLDERGKQESERIAELEADNTRFREKLETEGHSPESIARTMKVRDAAVAQARRRAGAVEAAKAAPMFAEKRPLRMGVDPTAPIQGKPGAVGPGIATFQEAYPLDLSRPRPIVSPPLPPARPAGLSRGIDSIDDVLGPGGKRGLDLSNLEVRLAPDSRLEATVKPDQITARVTEPVQVSGEVHETIQHQHQHTIELKSDMLDARIRSVSAQTVRTIPLTAGARSGAVSMPGAATTPGNQ